MEYNRFNRDDLSNRIDPAKLQTARVAAETGKALAGVILLVYFLTRFDFFRAFENSGDEFLHFMGSGLRVLVIIFLVLAVISFLENLLTLILLFRGNTDAPLVQMLLKISGVMRSGTGYFFMLIFGILFGGFGAFATFSTNVTKAEGTEIFGAVFMLIGIGICIAAIVSFIKMLIKEL